MELWGRQASWILRHYRDWIHSPAELSIDSREAANNPEVIEYIHRADALFIAGGDQNDYQEYWEGTKIEDEINDLVNKIKVPIAGTSAGMAILGDYYYAPDHKGVLSSEILDDPFHYYTETIDRSDFLKIPYLKGVMTDTHLDRMNSDYPETRYGRLLGLLARVINKDHNKLNDTHAIGLEEGAFVAIDDNGIAQVFGNGTNIGQDAYFLQPNGAVPEQIEPGWPLIWDNEGKAVKVYRISGTPEGKARAEQLVHVLSQAKINAIYSTNTHRTKETAEPLLDFLKPHIPQLDIESYRSAREVAEKVKREHSGQRLLIVSHSDMVEDIIEQLNGNRNACPISNDYDNLCLVIIDSSDETEVIELHYGEPSSSFANLEI